ncbi:MAG TPA: histidine phosphatase family protein, partial [Candidatus Paceibacterota bacterium]|nr:histidine phosphatase family protein [Candidatus Paceibacterota bacterium]
AGGLSEEGKEQAHRIGLYLGSLGIEAIYASPFERAKETAEIIAAQLHVPIEYSDLLRERKNPSDVIGKSTRDPEVEQIVSQIDLTFHDDTYRHADEENFLDLKARAIACLSYLASRPEQELCIVTHHAFLKMLLACMLYRDELHASDFVKLSFFNQSDNGGTSICEYRPWGRWLNKNRGWRVLSYNEQLGQ